MTQTIAWKRPPRPGLPIAALLIQPSGQLSSTKEPQPYLVLDRGHFNFSFCKKLEMQPDKDLHTGHQTQIPGSVLGGFGKSGAGKKNGVDRTGVGLSGRGSGERLRENTLEAGRLGRGAIPEERG